MKNQYWLLLIASLILPLSSANAGEPVSQEVRDELRAILEKVGKEYRLSTKSEFRGSNERDLPQLSVLGKSSMQVEAKESGIRRMRLEYSPYRYFTRSFEGDQPVYDCRESITVFLDGIWKTAEGRLWRGPLDSKEKPSLSRELIISHEPQPVAVQHKRFTLLAAWLPTAEDWGQEKLIERLFREEQINPYQWEMKDDELTVRVDSKCLVESFVIRMKPKIALKSYYQLRRNEDGQSTIEKQIQVESFHSVEGIAVDFPRKFSVQAKHFMNDGEDTSYEVEVTDVQAISVTDIDRSMELLLDGEWKVKDERDKAELGKEGK